MNSVPSGITEKIKSVVDEATVISNSKSKGASREKHYHRVDLLSQLHANLSQLEDSNSRLNFMMQEIQQVLRYKIKK